MAESLPACMVCFSLGRFWVTPIERERLTLCPPRIREVSRKILEWANYPKSFTDFMWLGQRLWWILGMKLQKLGLGGACCTAALRLGFEHWALSLDNLSGWIPSEGSTEALASSTDLRTLILQFLQCCFCFPPWAFVYPWASKNPRPSCEKGRWAWPSLRSPGESFGWW